MKKLITHFSKKSLSLENGSRMTRKRTGNGSMKSRKSLDSILSQLCLVSLICVLMLTIGAGNVWAAVGDALKTYDTNSSTFATGYASQAGDNFVWYGQKNYFGANNATTHGKIKPAAANLPVVKAQNASATTTTTGYYWCYTSEAVSNVGAVQITFSAKSGSSTVNAYVVSSSTAASSGSATWTKLTLLTGSPSAQGANVCNSGTYTFTFPKETSAKYYGVVFVTSSYWRATGFQMKLLEGCTAPTAVAKGTLTSSSFGLTITDAQNAGNYDIYFSTSSTAPTADLAAGSFSTVNTKTPTVSSGVSASTTYYVWARSSKTVSSVAYKSAWVALTGNTLTTPSAASCTADPTIGAASLNGSFNSGGVTSLTNTVSFSTTSCDPKTNCEWQDYGFVWGTSASPTVSNTKMQKGTSGDATSWDMTSPSTFTVDNTYKVRAYGKNGKAGAAFVYSASDLSFTPRSVAFNPNGGSAVATKYIRSGGTITNPGAPATPKTGYTFDSWRTDAGLGTAVNWSSAINSSTTYYAKWNPNNYTITLNDGDGSGGSGSVTATFDANTNLTSSVSVPTRTDYIFGGYWTGDNGTGTQIIDANGAFIASAGGGSTYTDASKNWKYANNITLKAKWTEHTYTNYRTKCCTDLGAIDGEATLTQGGNSVTISGWSDVANVGTYTVKMYKKNGGGTWDLVSGSTSGGSAGTQGTRTGITSGSKSVTYTGLVVESEYKFTVQAIAGSAAYCDGVETAVTEINSTDVSSTPFKFRYSIYIDNGSNSGWAHHYIEPTGNTDEGSVSITLGAHVDYYQFKIAGGFSGWWGQSGSSKIPANTKWTLDSDQNVRLETGAGGAYTFTVDYSGTTNPGVTVTFPSADQAADYKIYFDKSAVADWGATLKYRIGNGSHNQNQNFTLVAGTDQFYVTTTPDYDGMDAWQIANNVAWSGTNSIYNYYHGDGNDITRATVYQDYAVDEDITIVPTSIHNTENSCQFWDVSKTSGMLTHTATITAPSHGTITISNTDQSLSATSTTADLPHRTILTITATPATGYSLSSLTVNGAAFTSGNTHILAADATIAATFTAQTSTVTLDNNSATSGSQQTVTATYDAAMPLTTTASAAVAALSRTGYTFNGWWDATSGGTQYYTYSGSPKVIASARAWDKTGAQTLKAQWTVNQYTLTWDLQGGTVATAGTGAAAAATGTPSSSQDYGTALTAPVVTKTGYDFNVWSPSVAATMPAANTTYTASWTAQVYDITYKDQGDNAYSGNATDGVPTGAPTTHTYGSATALVNGVKDGYRFDGWFTDASCTVSAGSSIGATAKTADFTLYAKWTQVYTVTWSVNGDTWSSGVVDGNTYVPSGSKVSALPTAPTSSDCDDSKVFVGWRATAIDGTSASNPGSIFTTQAGSPTISANTTFYAVFADVTGGNVLDLTFPDDNSANNGLTSNQYTSEWTAKAGTFSFTINNFNNNNWGGSWKYIKCGRNGSASVAKITTGSDIDFRVDSVLVKLENITSSKVNSAKLQISSASTFETTTDMDIPQSSGWQRLKIASPATDKYYRIVYDCASNTSNGFVSISEVVFKQNYDTANYVTSCASCDANATYTNTTPTVSDIDCTSATLTMEEGLATVGADGCHVSDYGFVIGTSDNPVIGGSGVTKLQVGTSDPTIGDDFSYEATDLTKGTRYYIRAYAINRHGTAYSSSTNFWTNNVSSIAITTAPTKTNYLVGETFDATGMVVTATMADSNTEDVTSDVTYSTSSLSAGANQDFAINYTLCETAKSVNQKINVYTLTVTEGTNPSYGTAAGSVNIVSITGLGEHKTYTVTVTSSNATAEDNGDNTWTITNPTGNVAVRVDYADAAQVKVYYKVDGVTVTGLTQDVWQSETTTLPTASELATAMAAQSMDIPDDDYPNFIGWSETEFPAQTAEPTIVTGTPTISAEKIYYAVYTNLSKKQILPSDFAGSYATNEGAKTFDGLGYNIHDICLQSSKIHFRNTPGYLYSTSALSYIKKIEITGLDLIVNACSDNAGTLDGDAITPTGSDTYVYTFPASKQYFKIKGKGGTDKVSLIEIFYANATVYYMTEFCATKITLTHNSPEHGTVEFGRSSLATCGSDKNVSLTITPDLGYQLTGWTVNTATGYADAKTTSPAVVINNNNSAAQNITLTFAQDANKDYDVTATFGLMTVSSWAWTMHEGGGAIPDPLNLYVGQSARLDVAYTPASVDASKKTYTRTKVDAYINWVGALNANYSTISGKASTGENTTEVTFTHADGPSTTVNVKVLPLPAVHFGDIVHNVAFDDVVATLSDNTLSPTKTTPTHADFDGSTANTCEEQHLHLVGWIREDWPALVTYLEGGAQPTTSEITGAGNDGSGNAYYFAPGASINTQTFNGVTFYAVWAKVE